MANRLYAFARALAAALEPAEQKGLSPVDNRGGWWPILREYMGGAWQANVEVSLDDSLRYWAAFRCISIIAGDIGKLRPRVMQIDSKTGIWTEIEDKVRSPLLRKPNSFQTRVQFFESWMSSKLSRGNTYVLKQRNARGDVVALTVLDPGRTTPLVADNGDVFYDLKQDNLAGVETGSVRVPASEIIHDRWNTLYHPLVGLSPLYACAINSLAGRKIIENTAKLYANGARPGGVLTAPGAISDETAKRLKDYWDANFTGDNAGKVAVLGDNLKYEAMAMKAVDAQLIEQLKWDDQVISGCYGVPAYMINSGALPAANNVAALQLLYLNQGLQIHIEGIEVLLDEALSVEPGKCGIAFDLEDLLRLDLPTKVKMATDGLAGIWSPDEARRMFDLPPVEGGGSVYLQQQNYSLEALAKRDAKDDPFAGATPPQENDGSKPSGADNDNEKDSDYASEVLAVVRREVGPV